MKEKKKIHFVGICGTAMGSVAAALKRLGHEVTGSDQQVYPPMSDFLAAEGIPVREGYKAEHIPADADLIVIGNAISRGNEEAEVTLERHLPYYSLPEVMKEHLLRGKQNFVVTGTHGKTTTSSMLAWLFKSSGRDPGWMIGGVPKNLGRGASFEGAGINVLEGDEYDTAFFDKRSKFLHYLPELVIMNNIEFDHADIYHDIDEIKLSFERLLRVVPRNGVAVINGDDRHCREVTAHAPCPVVSVGMDERCDKRITEIEYTENLSTFTLEGTRYEIPMAGEFNIRNAAMAATAARWQGMAAAEIQEGFRSFQGVARRQEWRGEVGGVRVVDDFAHHPTAIRLSIAAMRQRYPGSRLWVLFEPRSNTTMRKVFQHELPESLGGADVVIIGGLTHPEKVAVADRLDPAQVAADVPGGKGCHIPEVADIVKRVVLEAQPGDTVAVFSNGGFGGIHQRLLDGLAARG